MTPLFEAIARRIRSSGPMPLAEYMRLALTHPEHGYYTTGDPLGAPKDAGGDFITAPEVSQMFGELLGLWCADTWRFLGQPKPVKLIELGPGRGTLMADALRAVKIVPEFAQNLEIHLVEISPSLRRQQEQALAAHEVTWHEYLSSVPEGPFLLLANELFDALPVRQFERTERGWRERLVGLSEAEDALVFVAGPEDGAAAHLVPEDLRDLPPGAVVELCPEGDVLAKEIGARVAGGPGAALLVDYGYAAPEGRPTLQALRRHRRHDPLADPGTADLTAHVDFSALGRALKAGGAAVHGPMPQGAFLEALGLGHRAEALTRNATERQRRDIESARERLTAEGQMGALFKVMAAMPPETLPPAGFLSD